MATHTYQLSLPLLDDAESVARALGHAYIGPEHLLLAVAARREGASDRFLEHRGLTAERLRGEIEAILGSPDSESTPARPLHLAQRAVVALGDAIRPGPRRGAGVPAADAMFSALLSDDVARGAVVGQVLERTGVSLDTARAEFAAASRLT